MLDVSVIKSLQKQTKTLNSELKAYAKDLEECIMAPKGIKHRTKLIKTLNKLEGELESHFEQATLLNKEIQETESISEEIIESYNDLTFILETCEENYDKCKEALSSLRSFRVFSCWNLKGGSAKTTMNYLLSLLLATNHNKRILAIDLDTQGTFTDLYLRKGESKTGIYKLYRNGFTIEDTVQKTPYENIDLISNNLVCDDVHDHLDKARNAGAIYSLDKIIKDNMDYLNNHYDYIFIDFAPESHSILNKTGFICVDSMLYLTYPEQIASTISGIEMFEIRYNRELLEHRARVLNKPVLSEIEMEQLSEDEYRNYLQKFIKKRLLVNRYREKDTTTNQFISAFETNPEWKEHNLIRLKSIVHETVFAGKMVDKGMLDEKANERFVNELTDLIKELMKEGML